MHRIAEVADVDEPNCDADERDDFGELLAELIQLLLQRRLLLLRARHLVTDLADLRRDGGANHNADGSARRDVGSLKDNKSCTEMHRTDSAFHPHPPTQKHKNNFFLNTLCPKCLYWLVG